MSSPSSRVRRRWGAAAASAALVSLTLAACGDDGGGSGEEGGETAPYKWGVNAELTGPIDGTAVRTGVEAYVKQVNAEGGINGRTIELVSLDSAADQSRAAANTTRLVTTEKVNAIFGHLLSANCTAGTATVERYKVPMACLSVAEANPYVYNLGPDNSIAAEPFVAAGLKVAGTDAPKIAFAYSTTLTNSALSEKMPAAVSDAGAELTESQGIALDANDVKGPAAKLVASDPDVILFTVVQPVPLVQAIRDAGYTGPVISLEGSVGLSFFPTSDKNLHVMSVYKFPDPESEDEAVKRYIEALELVKDDLDSFASYSDGEVVPVYLTAAAFGDALERCEDPCDGAQLKEQLDQTDLEFGDLVSSFTYTEDDHYPYSEWYLYKVSPDAAELVATLPQD